MWEKSKHPWLCCEVTVVSIQTIQTYLVAYEWDELRLVDEQQIFCILAENYWGDSFSLIDTLLPDIKGSFIRSDKMKR